MQEIEKFPEKHLNRIYNEKLFKMFVPKSLGGLDLSLPDALKIIKNLAEEDSNLGWAVAIGAGGAYFYPYMSDKVRDDVFKDPHAVIAGSGKLGGIAKPVDGGYEVTGKWPYSSGSLYATTFTANCRLEYDKESYVSVILPKKEVQITEDWCAFGLVKTESHSISVEKAFVPTENTFDLSKEPVTTAGDIQSFPFRAFAQSCFAMVAKGIWNTCITAAIEEVEDRQDTWEDGRADKVRATIQMADGRLKSVTNDFHSILEKIWDKHTSGKELSEADESAFGNICIALSSDASRFAHEIFTLLGMGVTMCDHPYNEAYRDLMVATQHGLLKWTHED